MYIICSYVLFSVSKDFCEERIPADNLIDINFNQLSDLENFYSIVQIKFPNNNM